MCFKLWSINALWQKTFYELNFNHFQFGFFRIFPCHKFRPILLNSNLLTNFTAWRLQLRFQHVENIINQSSLQRVAVRKLSPFSIKLTKGSQMVDQVELKTDKKKFFKKRTRLRTIGTTYQVALKLQFLASFIGTIYSCKELLCLIVVLDAQRRL